jgi:protein-L-isoaspartate O-methyltransferase
LLPPLVCREHFIDEPPGAGLLDLEVGTGTGYNTALLCHRLGADNVASVDLDPGLVEQARSRLAGRGHDPVLVAGDGSIGVADRAPYDLTLIKLLILRGGAGVDLR